MDIGEPQIEWDVPAPIDVPDPPVLAARLRLNYGVPVTHQPAPEPPERPTTFTTQSQRLATAMGWGPGRAGPPKWRRSAAGCYATLYLRPRP